MRRALTAVLVLAFTAVAFGQGNMTPPNYQGKSSGTTWGMLVKFGKSGKPVRILRFEWDGYKCGGDRFTGGSSKSIPVKDGKFKSTQLVGGIDQPLHFTVRGSFSADGKKATGSVNVQTCTAGIQHFTVKKHQGP